MTDTSAEAVTSDVSASLDAVIEAVGGVRRDGQQQMAIAVAEALEGTTPLLVQAPTGTGKSLAYLVPAVTRAVVRGEPVVISTATLALQRQLLTKDIPAVLEVLGDRLPRAPAVALLKGWHNYACRHKVTGGYPAEEEPGLFALSGGSDHPAPAAAEGDVESLGEQVVRARAWVESSETGDRDDLVPGVSERAWRQVSVTAMDCLSQRCPMLAECFGERARVASREADVVITNHAMLGIAAAGSPGVLPEHTALVVDEAHELPSRARAAATVELSAAAIEHTSRLARRHAGVVATDLDEAASDLRRRLIELPEGRIPDGLPEQVAAVVTAVASASRGAGAAMRSSPGQAPDGGAVMARNAVAVLTEIADRLLTDSVAQRRDVLWCSAPPDGPARLKVAPLDVASLVADHLFADRAVVLTSATLELGGSFAPVAASVGLWGDDYRGLRVDSPFDYGRQGIRYVARHLPPPAREGPSPQLLGEITDLVTASRGGALGLFSSRRAAEVAAAHVREATELTVWCQGDDTVPALVRAFADDVDSCLFGTLGLWQGVDVPGAACRLVLIDRIPFPRPDDPVASARTEVAAAAGRNGFLEVSASHAALLLAQGAGRLIRSSTDRGVVAILDPRLATARYGTFLAASLPPMWPTTDPEVARSALRRLAVST